MTPDAVAAEIAIEQAHVDKVYTELAKATERAALVKPRAWRAAGPTAPGRPRRGDHGLFERDALVFNANKRRATLETQYEGLVFGRLDLDTSNGADRAGRADSAEREVPLRKVAWASATTSTSRW
jgi:hypothetical protein